MSEWRSVQLKDVSSNASRAFDFRRRSTAIFINTGDVLDGQFLHGDLSDIRTLPGQAKKAIRKGDILYSEIRPGNGRHTLVRQDLHDHVVSTKFMVVESKPVILPEFLYYVLKSPECESEFKLIAESRSGTFPQITFDAVGHYKFQLPPLDEQRCIAHILGTLDDKIKLNRRMSETLEAMARAIFNSWFVDFNPVRAKASGEPPESICRRLGLTPDVLALFPDSFQNSELGDIPNEWSIRSIGELCDRVAMGPFGSNIKTDNFVPAGVPIIRGGNLTNGFVDDRFVFLTEEKADQLRNSNARAGNIVITHRGTLGQVGLIPNDSRYPRYVVSQSQMVLSVRSEIASSRYLYEFLRSPIGQQAILANTSQVGVPAIAQPTTSVKAIRVVTPPVKILSAYELATKSLFDYASAVVRQSATVTNYRDALLPKLLTGELGLGNAEREAATV